MPAKQTPADQASSASPTPLDLYRAYVTILPGWLQRFRISRSEADDIMQGVWLAISDGSVPIPKTVEEARFELFKVTRRIAQRSRRRERREALRQGPEPDTRVEDTDAEAEAMHALGLYHALERLSLPHRELIRDHCILGHTLKEMAARAEMTEGAMGKRVARALAELEQLRLEDHKLEEERNEKQAGGLFIVPFALDLDPYTRAAFCAMGDAEGSTPLPVSPPPPMPTAFLPFALLGLLTAIAAVAGVTAVVAAIAFRTAPPNTARTGLHVAAVANNVGLVKSFSNAPPAEPTSTVPATPPVVSSNPPIDPTEVERARRRTTRRFLPSNNK